MPGFRMLAFHVQAGDEHSKTLESFHLPSKFLFLKIFKSTHNSKTVQKVVSNIFQINSKIN
jgi:hypothetical protein